MGQLRKLGRANTVIKTDDKWTTIIYHSTNIVKFNNKEIILNTADDLGKTHHTKSTKDRMNQASCQYSLGYVVFQKDFEWFITFDGKTMDFKENIKLSRNGDLK
tara:strand:+ start:424 stop:735 length:312 start_codon:yes stop_codon:yes gene_type:complete